jgi:hypothetical protein
VFPPFRPGSGRRRFPPNSTRAAPSAVEVEPVLSGSMQSGGPGRQERAGGVPRFSAGISSKQPASKKEERSLYAEHHWDALALVFGVGNRASQTLTIRAEALWRHSGSMSCQPRFRKCALQLFRKCALQLFRKCALQLFRNVRYSSSEMCVTELP